MSAMVKPKKQSALQAELEDYRSQLRRWLDACWSESYGTFMLNPTLAEETKAMLDRWGIDWRPMP